MLLLIYGIFFQQSDTDNNFIFFLRKEPIHCSKILFRFKEYIVQFSKIPLFLIFFVHNEKMSYFELKLYNYYVF